MLDMPNKDTRIRWGHHGEYKAACMLKHGGTFFIESSPQQAEIIAKRTLRPVICIESNTFILKVSNKENAKRQFKQKHHRLFKLAKRLLHPAT